MEKLAVNNGTVVIGSRYICGLAKIILACNYPLSANSKVRLGGCPHFLALIKGDQCSKESFNCGINSLYGCHIALEDSIRGQTLHARF